MPARQSKNASSNVPTNLIQQDKLRKQERAFPYPSQTTDINAQSDSLRDPSLTPFPSLTGLRSRTRFTNSKSAAISSKVAFTDLHNATASAGASPVTALQAAWAVILSTYAAAQDDVAYFTVFDSPTSHTCHHPRERVFLAAPTRVSLSTLQKWGQKTNGSILKSLTNSNALALSQSNLSVLSATRHDQFSKHGTIVSLRSKGCFEDDDISRLSNKLIEGEELAVSLLAWPDSAGSLRLKAVYSDLVLNETSALVMLRQLEDVLAFILGNPAEPITGSLASVRSSLLSTSNENPEGFTELNSIAPRLHAQFEGYACHSPYRVALDFRNDLDCEKSSDNTIWTYEQLNERAENFATHLTNRFGLLTDEVIPICMGKCPELYVAILGILKVGGAWCPIDPSFPARRRHDLIARTGARILVVAEQSLVEGSDSIPQGVFTVDIIRLVETVVDRDKTSSIKMGSLAYLIWTSGTTGDPKGVPIHHEAAAISMRALQRSIPVDVTGGVVRCLQFSQFTFDVFVQDLFYTWGVGGTVISATREIMLGSFAELATKTKSTHAHLTPAFAASLARERCPTLEVITMIGEKLPQTVADGWSLNMRAFNTYGPAETTVVSTLRQFGDVGDEVQSENIGFPLVSVAAFVMRDNRPLMRQGIGELALGGPQLSKGYWNDPERSSERFLWNEQYSTHLYMTGDLVRQLHDGSLEFVGRADDLIKIQGIRVELSEISFSLRSCHPLIEQVEVQYLDRQDRPSKVIVAFLAAPTLDKTKKPSSWIIKSEESIPIAKSALLEARANLPDYMIPSVFLVINSIPRTSSAKTDKAVLKEIYSSIDLGKWENALASNDNSNEGVSAWSTRESDIVTTVAEFSGTSRHSMTRVSDLRSIGIDSIAATRLAPLLKAKGFSVSVADILRCQNLVELLKVTDKPCTMHMKETYDIEAFHNEWYIRVRKEVDRSDMLVVPALPLQESLLSETMQNASAYWSNALFSLDAQVDITRLYEAWLQVVRNTEALRTGFIPSATILGHHDDASSSGSTFMQLIYEEATIDWTYIKLSEAGVKDFATKRALQVAESRQKSHFREPLLAITVFEQPDYRAMLVSVHHSVRDEASLDFILEDVFKSYQEVGQITKQRHQLREALQLMLPTNAQIGQNEAFWTKALHDFITIDDANTWPDLTGNNTHNEDPAAGLISHTLSLSINYKDLQSAALGLGASSVASILRIAWGTVLLGYLETDSVVFAETWSNRVDDFVLADIVGPLITVLPVAFRALGSAREALLAQSNFQRESRAHRSIHSRVVKKLLNRSENQPLYPAMFNFLPDLREDNRNGFSSIWTQMGNTVGLTVEHPLALNVAQAANGVLEMEISASKNVISYAHLAILAQQVDAFVEAILKFPDVPLTQLSSCCPKELLSVTSVSFSENVRHAWKQNPTDWVNHHAEAHPHWPAAQVVTSLSNEECESESWNFAELRAAYHRVAAFIGQGGYFKRMIAVCLDRRIEAYAVVLGILASGNIYLPIDEDLPRERKSFLLQDSTAAMLFTTKHLALSFASTPPELRVNYVDDSTYKELMVDGYSVEMPSQAQASDNAYLLYTSGSTGVPKGVLVGRGNLCSFIEGLSEFIYPLIPGMEDLPGKGKYLGLASRAFDVHIAEMFLAWRQGLAAVTATRTMLLDNLELALRQLKITHASFVPSLIDQAGLDPTILPDLHYLGVGGEKMSKRVVDMWASNENAALVNAYGPTEMSIGCTAAVVTQKSNLRNVGRPYGNSVAHVLVPGSNSYTLRGVAGELCFTGDLVANGYYNRPGAKGFVDDFNGKRMYRTGDIVRMMADDTLEYLRREDDQTKVRGQRLELGEITEAIRSTAVTTLGLKKIDVATMIAQHPKLPRPQLVSFIVLVPRSNKTSDFPEILSSASDYTIADKIQAGCRKVLPAYMVPDVVIPLKNLPLAPSSGKADFKRLKALYADTTIADMMHHTSSDQNHMPESSHRELTEAEKDVRGVVISTLAVDTVDISANTNLFRLGLDSLSAISLVIKLQKLGFDCTVSSVLRKPLIEQLALLPRKEQIEGATVENASQTSTILADLESRFRAIYSYSQSDSSIQTVKPCLPLQETLVATSLNEKSTVLYVNHLGLRLSIGIDHARLEKAWSKLVADHSILRTCFQQFENGMIQVVLKYDERRSVYWKETVTRDPETASLLQQSESATEIISDIASKAPIRLTMFRPPSDDTNSILLFSIHHALYDGESLAMVLQELNLRYHSAILPTHTSFDSIIEYVISQDQEASKTFWTKYLAHYNPTSVTGRADTTSEELDNNCYPTMDRMLSSPLADLESFSSSISVTLTSTIQAVFGIILAQTLAKHDVVFGVVLSGRTVPIESPHTILAPCITTIPQRVNLRANGSTIVDVIKQAQQGFVASLDFQHTGLRHIHRWLGAEKPLFDCLVSYIQKSQPKSSPYPDLWTQLEHSMPDDFPLSIEFEVDHECGRLRAHCAFSPAFGDTNRAESLLEAIDLLLGALIRREDVTTEDLGISKSDALDSSPKPQIWDESTWSPRELKIRQLAADICDTNAEDILKGASFFSLGIDSITAIRFAQGLRQSGMEYSSADVMRYSCIAALAQKIDNLPPHINGVENPADRSQEGYLKQTIPKIPTLSPSDVVTDVYACTPLQSSMLTQTLGSDGRLYFHHHALRLASHIDLGKIEQAWKHLTTKTEILRTTFHFSDTINSWLAAVHQASSVVWTELDVKASLSHSLTGIMENSVFLEEADFEQQPWKATVLKTTMEIVLVISMHHSLYDGESISLLFQDLASLYEGSDLPPRAPFSDAGRAISESTQDAEEFWLSKLDDFENSEVTLSQKATETGMIEIETTLKTSIENILQGCKLLGVTVQTVALLAYGKTLACISGRRDVVFGHVIGGRSLAMPGADEVVGPLFNTVPSRIVFDKTYVTNKSAAIKIQQSSGDSQPHQHASLGRIQQAWRQKVGDANAQLFNTLFVFQNNGTRISSTDKLWTSLNMSESAAPTEYATNFEFEHREERTIVRVASRKALTTRAQLQNWLIDFEQVFQDILEHPQRSVMAFPPSLQALPITIRGHRNRPSPQDEIRPGPDLECIRTALSAVSGISLESILIDTSIFSLGLDSISAIRLAATCRKQGYDISVADVLQGRSLGGICGRLRERKLEQDSCHAINQSALISAESRSKALVLTNLKDEDIEGVLPCLAGQVYHLAAWLRSRRTMCEAIWTFQCSKHLSEDDLRLAWRGLRERHPVLRTLFVAISNEEAVQMVLNGSSLSDDSFEFIEIPDNSEDRLIDQIKLESNQPFDLFSPPSKICLVRGENQDFVILKLHHATYDAWTIPTMIEDLTSLYHHDQLPSPPLSEPFINHTIQNLHTLSSQAYWLQSLQNSQPTILKPTTSTTIPTATPTILTLHSAIPSLSTLETLCLHTSTTLPTLILLAHARALARHTSIASPTFGLYQTGRSAPITGMDTLCFPCLSVLPVLIRNASARPAVESARGLQADLAERVEYEQSYLHKVLEWAGCGNRPLFNTFVNILSYDRPQPSSPSSSSPPPRTTESPLLTPCALLLKFSPHTSQPLVFPAT